MGGIHHRARGALENYDGSLDLCRDGLLDSISVCDYGCRGCLENLCVYALEKEVSLLFPVP